MTDPTPLSPAAQAVKNAFDAEWAWDQAVAAALRAAADQLDDSTSQEYLWEIADELEGANG